MKSKAAVTNNKAAKPIPAPISAFAPVLRPVPDEDGLATRDVVVEVDVAAESVEGVLLDEALLDEVSIDKVEGDDAGPGADVETLVPVMGASM
jgi:hypothetical protein